MLVLLLTFVSFLSGSFSLNITCKDPNGKACLIENQTIDQMEDEFEIIGLPSNIRIIEFQNCSLKAMPPLLLASINQTIENFVINNSELTPFKNEPFKYTSDLKSIIVIHCSLTEIEISSFKGLSKLLTLSLRKNALTELTEGVFDDLEKIKFLDVSYNSLTRISRNLFRSKIM